MADVLPRAEEAARFPRAPAPVLPPAVRPHAPDPGRPPYETPGLEIRQGKVCEAAQLVGPICPISQWHEHELHVGGSAWKADLAAEFEGFVCGQCESPPRFEPDPIVACCASEGFRILVPRVNRKLEFRNSLSPLNKGVADGKHGFESRWGHHSTHFSPSSLRSCAPPERRGRDATSRFSRRSRPSRNGARRSRTGAITWRRTSGPHGGARGAGAERHPCRIRAEEKYRNYPTSPSTRTRAALPAFKGFWKAIRGSRRRRRQR